MEELCETVVDVGWVSDRMMAVELVFYKDVLRLICGHSLHCGKSLAGNLYDEWDVYFAIDSILCSGD